MLHSMNASWGPWKEHGFDEANPIVRLPVFYTTLQPARDITGTEGAIVKTGIATWRNLEGRFLEYDVVINGQSITLPRHPDQGRFVHLANNTQPLNEETFQKKQLQTLDAITLWLSIFINANASVVLNEAAGSDAIYNPDPATYNVQVFKHIDTSVDQGIDDMVFVDPMPGIVFKYNQLMFREAAKVAYWANATELLDRGVSVNQTVQANQTLTRPVFRSDLRWFIGAAVFELVTVLLILPMFWGMCERV